MEHSKSSEGSEKNVSSSSSECSSINLEQQLENMRQQIQQLKLQNSIQQSTIEILSKTQNLKTPNFFDNNLPVTTENDLVKLTKLLQTNDSYKTELTERLVFHMDREDILSRSIKFIMKKILSKDVAILFTPIKPMTNKTVFKGSPLYEFIHELVTAYCLEKTVVFSETEFDQELTKVLKNIQH